MKGKQKGTIRWGILGSTVFVAAMAIACGGSDADGSGGCPVDGEPGTQRRIGPFATQQRAIERRLEHEERGCEVSVGTFPCFDDTFTRGHCFNVFFD